MGEEGMTKKITKSGSISRRHLLTTVSAGAALAASPFRINLLQAQEATIKIGFPVPLTGPYGTEAQDQVRAGQLAIRFVHPIFDQKRDMWGGSMKRRTLLGGTIAVAMLGLTSSVGAQQPPIKIGMSMAQTGGLAGG